MNNARRHDDELQMCHGLGRQCRPQRRRAQRHAGECNGAVFRRAFHRRGCGAIGPGAEYALRVLTIPMDGGHSKPALATFPTKPMLWFRGVESIGYVLELQASSTITTQPWAHSAASASRPRRSFQTTSPSLECRHSPNCGSRCSDVGCGKGFRTPAARRALPGSPSVAKVVALSNSDYHLSANGFRLHSLETRPTPS